MSSQLNLTVAVFAGKERLMLVHLEDEASERAVSDAAASGYEFAGCIAVYGGEPKVQIEPGFESVVVGAGVAFAELVGPMLKREQLERMAH